MIIEKAQELGLALSESEEFRAMMDAQAAVDANAGIQALMEQYTQKRETIVSMMEMCIRDRSHTVFIAEVTEAKVLRDVPSVTYAYYHAHIKPKPCFLYTSRCV